ncbi:twitching motility protein PilT [Bombiscardovia nodaiensis]|uniref:Twitching motility protein PilT n=1 Tax=Bombiscardovia nodaiensis TaxID=2932181 RepID=A0ABM8B694_9BIFI|nr:twitching motility protein PilT [Bombiscardovia nodaiensis]
MVQLYLLDANVLIDSHRQHHPFMYAEFHPFWKWMEKLAGLGEVRLLDVVYQELTVKPEHKPLDTLGEWVSQIFGSGIMTHKTDAIGAAFAQVQDYLVTCSCYGADAIKEWEKETKADPWLIAAAMANDAIIVTNEVGANPQPTQPQNKEPKIPDVAHAFGVDTMNLRAFYDANGQLVARDYPIQGTLLGGD